MGRPRRASNGVIVLAGNIGVGKTTLADLIAQELAASLWLESVDDNPFLDRFYADMPRWAFHLNMHFLGSRAKQLFDAERQAGVSVFDRSLYEDPIFVGMAVEDGVTPLENQGIFATLYDLLEESTPRPDVLVYLHAAPDVLLERIQARGRSFEEGLTLEYLKRLDHKYSVWRETYSHSPIVDVDTGSLDFDAEPARLKELMRQIRSYLPIG